MKNDDFPLQTVSSPEGTQFYHSVAWKVHQKRIHGCDMAVSPEMASHGGRIGILTT